MAVLYMGKQYLPVSKLIPECSKCQKIHGAQLYQVVLQLQDWWHRTNLLSQPNNTDAKCICTPVRNLIGHDYCHGIQSRCQKSKQHSGRQITNFLCNTAVNSGTKIIAQFSNKAIVEESVVIKPVSSLDITKKKRSPTMAPETSSFFPVHPSLLRNMTAKRIKARRNLMASRLKIPMSAKASLYIWYYKCQGKTILQNLT